jgi:serine/threonine-protein kinase
MQQSVETTDATTRDFLRHRVARFGLLVAALFATFAAFRVVATLALAGDPALLLDASLLWHFVAMGAFFSVWVACRLGPPSTPYVRTVESVGLLAGAVATAAMGSKVPIEATPELIILLALAQGLIARSVYVPSTPRRTLLLGAAMGVPIIVATYLLYRDPPAYYAEVLDHLGMRSQPIGRALSTVVWWALCVTVATSASSVIYGLRKQVRDAKQVGQYRLEEKIGEGGMGMVYKARHAMLRRPTAVKLLPPDRTGDAIERFEREVQLTASLRHPNTVTIYDYGRTTDGVFYYAMELIDGATLDEIVQVSGAQPAARVRAIIRQAADALVEAHGIGLIHRDIKPANIMVFLPHQLDGLDEMAKVVDFGLVKEIQSVGAPGSTSIGTITGTPQYMAPESIVDPTKIDGRVDIYALGAVAYYLLTGSHVFEAKTIVEMCSKHLSEKPEAPSRRLGEPIDATLEALVLRCLEKDPAKRPPTAAALREELDALAGLGSWNADDARAWWSAHAAELSKQHERVDISTGETIDVRFAHRDTMLAPPRAR